MKDRERALQALADRDVDAWPDMPARLIHVLAPRLNVDVEVAAGVADRTTGEPLMPGSRFNIGSVTKSFVSASALRLVEQGRLSLDAPLDSLLPGRYLDVLRHGGYDTAAITLRHLLTHTSGIYDFASSVNRAIAGGLDAAIAADPRHRWTRLEQVRFAVDHGEPYGPAGRVFGYSCTNANLVGELLERTTGLGMGAAIAALVGFQRLGITQTYQVSVDPEPVDAPQRSHQYEGDVDIDSIDPSVGLWGCGGLVSTCRDLARFFRALLRGEIFEHEATREILTTRVDGVDDAVDREDPRAHAMFLFGAEIRGEQWWGHGGAWGTVAYTCPRLDITVVAGHQQLHMPEAFDRLDVIGDVMDILMSRSQPSQVWSVREDRGASREG